MNFLTLLGKYAGTSNACFGTGVYIPVKAKQSSIDLRCGAIFVSDHSNGRAQALGCVHWRTHTCALLTKQLGVFATWADHWFSSLPHTMTHALSVFALHLTQTAPVSVSSPFKHEFRFAIVKDSHKQRRFGLRLLLQSTGQVHWEIK